MSMEISFYRNSIPDDIISTCSTHTKCDKIHSDHFIRPGDNILHRITIEKLVVLRLANFAHAKIMLNDMNKIKFKRYDVEELHWR